jgi:uncharacterized phage protein gp47/JayE
MQLLHDDMFIQTMSALALVRAGEMYGRPQKPGTLATGSVRFTGTGGTYIPLGSIVSAPRASQDDALDFQTTVDGTIPNPGIPTAPTTADNPSGVLPSGMYEHAVSFVTMAGETVLGAISTPLAEGQNNRSIMLTNIPLGGPGTIGRKVYRRVNGGPWMNVDTLNTVLADNTTTSAQDNDNTPTGSPLTISTAEQLTLAVEASDVGTDYNVAVGTITDISEGPQGLSSVTNAAALSGGSNMEDIEAFRLALLEWVRAPQSGSPADMQAWAESIDGVESASVFPNVDLSGAAAPGTVSVRITGVDGTIPSPDIQTAVLNELLSHDLANITILVGTFTPRNINVTVTTTLDAGYILADVTASSTAAITNYINSVPVGGTIYQSGIIDSVFGLPGIVNVTTTFTDTTLAATEKAIPGTITVS